jgi:TrmH family RNA methyltransferase
MPSDPSFRRVASRQNAVVARARQLARGRRSHEVLIEGATLVSEAVAAGWSIALVAMTDESASDPLVRRLLETLPPATDRVLVPPAVMDAMSPVRSPSGVIAIARCPGSVPSLGTDPPSGTDPRLSTDAARLVHCRTQARTGVGTDPGLLVCAVDVQDPGNVGAIVRVAEAAGATGLLTAGASADPFGWKALRGAMGSAFRLPITPHLPVGDALAFARARGCRIAATVLDGTPIDEADLTGPLCVCVGAEGTGLPPIVMESADLRLTIPMAAPVESLNVAVATAIVLYEIRRQRRRGHPPLRDNS